MRQGIIACLFIFLLGGCSDGTESDAGNSARVSMEGFIDLAWEESTGRLLISVESFDEPFLYQSSLPRGVGSNDLGLDRGQLGQTRIVRFLRSGSKVLLVADNLDYRANSDDADERQAIDESFARSVLWGFEVESEVGGGVLVDGTGFFLRDAHEIGAQLSALAEGEYSANASRSAIYLERTRAFPDNTEVEAIVTLVGKPAGEHLPTVVPDPSAITVHMHHSFIRLPDDGYEPLAYDPRAGVIGLGYGSPGFADYATPIGDSLSINYGRRHRLEKKNPEAEVSEPVEPIVYYVDRGAPEPVRSALIDGAAWWNEAFEAAGYRDAFRVELLPEDADPMDARYNVIQWVHRSTRGWSYGASIVDPRTGEIIKGHVTLGSLRVRQDYMIAEGLLAPYVDETIPGTMIDMALSRIRQLSAHEVGHTIGFEHNFAASTQDRSSVMDYPFPLVRFADDGTLDFSGAYDTGIGDWDKRTVIYAYQDFPDDVDAHAARRAVVDETIADGYAYVADADARSVGSAHPDGNLWDNGADAIDELAHLSRLRAYALERFSDATIRAGRPVASLEEVLVPVYLLHRFQLHAVGKLVGGVHYDYQLRGDGQSGPRPVDPARQRQAIDALLATLDAEFLGLPRSIVDAIPPRPPGHPRSRETFVGATGVTFDPLAPAAAASALTLQVLLDPTRAARMARGGSPDFAWLVDRLLSQTWDLTPAPPLRAEVGALQRQTNMQVLDGLLRLALNGAVDGDVRATALAAVDRIRAGTGRDSGVSPAMRAHLRFAAFSIDRALEDPASLESVPAVEPPPGSPIGAAAALFGTDTAQ